MRGFAYRLASNKVGLAESGVLHIKLASNKVGLAESGVLHID
jgi:hypothetical protein